MSHNNFSSPHSSSNRVKICNEEFNNIEAVESVYTADSMEIDNVINCLNVQNGSQQNEQFTVDQAAANDDFTYPDIYSLSSARKAKHDRTLERRSSKCLLTDRRSAARLTASGEARPDRRAENRAANIQALRQSVAVGAANDAIN